MRRRVLYNMGAHYKINYVLCIMFLSMTDSVMISKIKSIYIFCNWNSLFKSMVDGIDDLDDLNVVLTCQRCYIIVNKLFVQLRKCEK